MYLTSNAFIQFHLQDLEEIRRQDRNYAKKHDTPINPLVKSLKSKIQGFKNRFLPYPGLSKLGKVKR